MDVIFDIDGTLANAAHRLHLIQTHGAKDWETFLSDEMVAQDTPIEPVWRTLIALASNPATRILFITGRPETQRMTTYHWLTDGSCPIRAPFVDAVERASDKPVMLMRAEGDRRPSHIVKEGKLDVARKAMGYNPVLVFEDRKHDAEMWRRNGLICAQVAEGDY